MDYSELRNMAIQLANLQIGSPSTNYWNRKYYMYYDDTNNTKKY